MKNVLLLIPRCMCNKNCIITCKENISGYNCSKKNGCDRDCQVYQIKKMCNIYGIKYKLASTSSVKKTIEEQKPSIVIGIACEKKLKEFKEDLHICLELTGESKCKNSKTDLSELKKIMEKIKDGM